MKTNSDESYQDLVIKYKKINVIQKTIIIVLTLMVIALLLLTAYLGAQSKTVPYVIELSHDGQATYYKDAVKLLENYTPSDITQKYFLQDYIIKLRSVSSDNHVNEENVYDVCAKTTGQAISAIDNFYRANNPLVKNNQNGQTVVIPKEEIAVIQYSPNKWKLTWRETTYRKADKLVLADQQFEGVFDTAFYTPSSEDQLERNPIGMYVINFNVDYVRSLI